MIKEYNKLSYFSFRALFMGIGLSKILNSTHSYFFISIIIGTILGLLIMYLYNNTANKYISIISNLLLLIMLFTIIINMISTMYLTDMSRLMIGIPFLLLIIYQITKPNVNIYRVANILLILNLTIYIFASFSLTKYIDLTNIEFTNFNLKTIISNSILYALFSISPYIFNKDENTIKYKSYKTYIISSITISLIFFFTISILGNSLIELYRYPEYIILKKVSFTNAIENIENIVCFMWIFDIYMLMINSANQIKNNVSNKILLYLILISSLFIAIIILKYYQLTLLMYNYSGIVLGILLILNIIFHKKTLVRIS